MKARALRAAAAMLACICLGGCWDYRGLDELSVIAGLAVDRGGEDGRYLVSLEMVDMTAPIKDGALKTILMQAEGKTVFDAVHEANKKLYPEMYLGETELLVISHQLAATEGISGVIESLMRDNEARSTIDVVISREDSAHRIITPGEDNRVIISHNLSKYIGMEKTGTEATQRKRIYQLFNEARSGSGNLVLPAFRYNAQEQHPQPELAGLAVCRGDKLAGYLENRDARPFIFLTDTVRAGIFAFPLEEGGPFDASLRVNKGSTRKAFDYTNGKLTIELAVGLTGSIQEMAPGFDLTSDEHMSFVQQRAAEEMNRQMLAMIGKVRDEFGVDIFGFGTMIQKRDPALWAEIGDRFDEIFCAADIRINTTVLIGDAGL